MSGLPRSAGAWYPAGAGNAPSSPQLSRGELYRNSEQGSFLRVMASTPVSAATYIIPVSGSTAAPPSMLTPPLAPGAYQEQGIALVPSVADPGMK